MKNFACPECHEPLRIPDNLIHTPGRCPSCHHKFVPADEALVFDGETVKQEMDNKNNRGFSRLTDLTSDGTVLAPVASQVPIATSASPQKRVFALLELTKWPTLPAPWSSVDSGETWVWGDYFLTFQKKPQMLLDVAMEMQGKTSEYRGMTYHYAMTVFYRADRNPHGPSHRPIMTVALEQSDMSMLARIAGINIDELLQSKAGSGMGPMMLGLFTGDARFNLGDYNGAVAPQAIRNQFFKIIGDHLGLSGQPKMIGDLRAAHGHPETGLPAKKNSNGCAAVILLCLGIGFLSLFGL